MENLEAAKKKSVLHISMLMTQVNIANKLCWRAAKESNYTRLEYWNKELEIINQAINLKNDTQETQK